MTLQNVCVCECVCVCVCVVVLAECVFAPVQWKQRRQCVLQRERGGERHREHITYLSDMELFVSHMPINLLKL